MSTDRFDINKLRIASPCPVGWGAMTGDDRKRHCNLCRLNVYNVTDMTKAEVEDLVRGRAERLCVRLYRRTDGTVLTRDCPIGIRGLRRRASRFVGAALGTILGLFSISYGQKEDKKSVDPPRTKIDRVISDQAEQVVKGVAVDPMGAVVAGATITLRSAAKVELKTSSNDEGSFRFGNLQPGEFLLSAKAAGFKPLVVKNLKLENMQSVVLTLVLEPGAPSVTVGILGGEPILETTTPTMTWKLTKRQIDSLPH